MDATPPVITSVVAEVQGAVVTDKDVMAESDEIRMPSMNIATVAMGKPPNFLTCH